MAYSTMKYDQKLKFHIDFSEAAHINAQTKPDLNCSQRCFEIAKRKTFTNQCSI